jgi:hypothetical protein
MKKTNQYTFILVLVLTFSLSLQISQAQVSTTFYHMYGIPQANQLNPAFQPHCDGYLGFPMLSPLNFSLESNPLQYNDIFSYNSQMDSIITFMHPNGDKEAFLNSLKPYNSVNTSVGSGPLSIGWRNKQFYFTIDYEERIELNAGFTKDFAEFVLNGNRNQERFNFSETGFDLDLFHELALGISYNYEDEFQVGARVKVLFGLANVNTRLSDITLRAYEDRWDFNSKMMIDVAGPELSIPVDSTGFVIWDSIPGSIDANLPDEINSDFIKGNLGTFFGTGNLGFGVDLGFSFNPIENLSISASVNDLAFIRWKNNAYQLKQDGTFGWEGIEVKLDKDWKPDEDLLDSLKNQMNFTSVNKPYTTFLSGKVYLGAAYEINDKVKFGVIDRARIYNQHFFNQLTLSANVMPIQIFSATLSYSIIGQKYMNFGLGLSLRLGPFNMYFITDQAPSGYLFPDQINSANFRLGLNLVFGCAKIPKKLKDRPLID